MPKNHANCKKYSRWYQTCEDIWVKAEILALKEKERRGIKEFRVSELLDLLILEKTQD